MSKTPPAKAPTMMSVDQANQHHTLAIVQKVIAETTGNDIEDVTLDADLEEDLGINMVNEFPVIIGKLQKTIPDVILPIHAVKDCATVAELVEVIDEERDL